MNMKKHHFFEKKINGLYEINVFLTSDSRGNVFKEYSKEIFFEYGVQFDPCEVMLINSSSNVLRGLHCQLEKSQDKIVRCITGLVWAVVVDLRPECDTFGKWEYVEINNGLEAYVPKGCALGTLAMEDSQILCMFGEKYYRSYDFGIIWNDKDINIPWPINKLDGDVVLSDKDASWGTLKDYKVGIQR